MRYINSRFTYLLTHLANLWLSAGHMFLEFVDHPKMKPIKDRTVWVHINIPGQSAGAADLPAELAFICLQHQPLSARFLSPTSSQLCIAGLPERGQL